MRAVQAKKIGRMLSCGIKNSQKTYFKEQAGGGGGGGVNKTTYFKENHNFKKSLKKNILMQNFKEKVFLFYKYYMRKRKERHVFP